MNGDNIKDIVDAMYCDFNWYGKFTKADSKRFLELFLELKKEIE